MGDGGSSASLIAAELRSSSSGCEQEPPERFCLPRPAGSPCGGSALARLPPGQVSARATGTAGHGHPGAVGRGRAGQAGGTQFAKLQRSAGPRSRPLSLSSLRRAPPPRLGGPPQQSTPEVPAAARIFCLSCLCVCCFSVVLVFFFPPRFHLAF